MSHLDLSSPKPRCTSCAAFLLLGFVLLVVLSGRVALVVEKVISGAGMEHCCSIEGVPFNYLAIFSLLCGVAVALLIASGLQLHNWLVRRDFERKFGVKVPAMTRDKSSVNGGSDYSPSMHGYDHHDGD
jgi:hypothetical protein